MTDSYETSSPVSFTPAGPEPPADEQTAGRLTALRGFAGFGIAIVGVLIASGIVAAVFAASGGDLDSGGFIIAGTVVQDLVMLGVAWYVVADLGRPTPRTFGLRPFRPSALGWALLAFVTYLVLTAIYAVLVDPPSEQLPSGLENADQDVLLAVATGVLLVGVAPFAEEFFFRGFLYQAFRGSFGVLPAALISGLVFGAIHLEWFKVVQLAMLGVILALLFEKTKSLWPPILFHAVNNALAYTVLLSE